MNIAFTDKLKETKYGECLQHSLENPLLFQLLLKNVQIRIIKSTNSNISGFHCGAVKVFALLNVAAKVSSVLLNQCKTRTEEPRLTC